MAVSARAAAFACGLAALVAAAPVAACGYHSTLPDLAAAHARSIDVALAVRGALDRGELKPLEGVPPALGYVRAMRMLRDLQAMVPALAPARAGSVAVLLVDSGLWSRYVVAADGATVEVHVGGPREGEPVIVTSEAVVRALLDGALEPGRATRNGMLLIA